MASLNNLSTLISRLCQFIGGISLVIIVLTTMLDVIARYIFKLTGGELGFTVKGSVEIVSYFMLFALLAAFAAFVERSQIIVDVFTQKMSQAVKGYMMGVFMIGFFIIGLVFTWGLYESAIDAIEFGKVTQDLRISMMPIYAISAFLSLLLAIRSLIESINIFKTGEFFDAEETGA
ncbi:TRAP transporter small permease subunit [Psychrobacter sp. Cmf 22.2]|jgi:TRAP-type C4-dicarboxylate transport system permease small subunit|uniref:TRAP transporter small permease n=1 Tax=Psychrobacter sp. Cmf 22.2 TaxID=1926478 RepID=UPI0009471264|nr:TRAP transporter small permease subunit [Psychrobacter sp. Cmf 22.2]OLF35628.1 C4-dicarboxylate ABC transporter permease [Psychrobacter sp. Cmf 22.2]